MRGYSGAELHQNGEDLDEYEEDGEGQGEGDEEEVYEEEEEEEEEEEDPKPTKEELEYLELRQRIKESLRKKMKKESAAVPGQALQKKNKLPYDNYGSFFGPSQPVIARRVIEESKSLLETQHLASKVSNSHHGNKTSSASTTAGTKPGIPHQPPKVINELKMKAQKLKDARDYSFLLSDDAELPAPAKAPPPRNASVPSSDTRPAQVPVKSKQPISKPSRPVSNGREERKPVPTNRQLQPKAGSHQEAPTSRPNSNLAPRKQLGSNAGNGPGRPVGRKDLPSKMPAPTMDKKASAVGEKRPVPGMHKATLSKLHSSVQKQHLEQKREFRKPDKTKVVPKQPVPSKPQIKAPKQVPVRATMQDNRLKRKPARQYSDEDEDGQAIGMIRKMFGYNPKKYSAIDDDDSDMEANFDDILKEERKSARIAREEDERELRLIEEEEKRERMRKLKKLKQSKH